MDEQTVAVHIAELKGQVGSIDARMENMEKKLDQLVLLDRTIAELNVHRENDKSNKEAIWNRIDNTFAWREAHEHDEAVRHASLVMVLDENSKSFVKACTSVESKVDEWVNRGKGALYTASLLLGFIQICVLASIGWTFTHISALEINVIALETRVTDQDRISGEKALSRHYPTSKDYVPSEHD